MNTWGAQAAYAAFFPGLGPTWESLYGFALGASVVLLGLVVMRSPGRFNPRWRPADLWQRLVRLNRARRRRSWRVPSVSQARDGMRRAIADHNLALAGTRRNSRSRLRQRVDLLLLRMLGDALEEQHKSRSGVEDQTPRSGQPAAKVGQARIEEPTGSTGRLSDYKSKHRLAGPPKESQNSQPPPRHAAPPAG